MQLQSKKLKNFLPILQLLCCLQGWSKPCVTFQCATLSVHYVVYEAGLPEIKERMLVSCLF
jgi:hypothetical protein